MDTVTEARLAITMAQEGGMGIVHKNMTIAGQAAEVAKVKKHEAGVIRDPISVSPDMTIRQVMELTRAHGISGVPVVQGRKPVGIVTHRDLRFETQCDAPVSTVMTPQEQLVTVREGASKDEVQALLHKHRIEKVLVVNSNSELTGLITVKDIQKAKDFPRASKDDSGRLRVGAAVGTSPDTLERAEALAEADVDVIVVDTAHGHTSWVLETVAAIKRKYPHIQVIGGNIVTAEAAKALAGAGADAVKVGIGPGSICTTRIVAGVGVPQISAVATVAKALEGTGVSLIADGGVRYSGDIAKALSAGAHCVMIGGLFAGTEESPGEVELYQGASYKQYRGMGSLGAMAAKHGSADRYFQDGSTELEKLVPEGIEGRVQYKGSLVSILYQLSGGLRAAMVYTGTRTVHEMRTKTKFVRITGAGMRESHVHDVQITKEAPNYRVT
jgi:IMP dehydrogenase